MYTNICLRFEEITNTESLEKGTPFIWIFNVIPTKN